MKKAFILSNMNNLRVFLKENQGNYSYIVTDFNCGGIEDFKGEKRLKKINLYEGSENLDFKKEYVNFIGGLNAHYNSIYWWANSISHKGAFVSNLYKEIYSYYCAASLIKKYGSDLIIISDNPIINRSIKKYCLESGIECYCSKEGLLSSGFLSRAKRILSNSVFFIYNGWSRKILSWIYLSGKIKKSLKKDNPYYVIKTWIEKRSFTGGGRYSDVFFGRLPGYLKEKGRELIILGGVFSDYKELLGKMKAENEYLIIPQEYYAGYSDYLKAVVFTFFNKPKISGIVRFCGLDVTDFLIECLRRDYEANETGKNMNYYYYMKGFLKNVKTDTFVYTFENQAWEKMSLAVIREYSPATKIAGYAHSSIRPSMLGYFYSKEEERVMPFPDKIITIGEEPKKILEMSGNYKERVNLAEGCALRYEYIFKRDRLKRNKNGKILAGFSIDISYSLKLLRFLCDALGSKPGYEVILRSHPFTPVEMIAEKYGIKLNDNFKISKNPRLEDDLIESSLIVYVDTTASIEALLCGMPAIYVDFKEPISMDPLFKLNSLKFSASNREELLMAIENIYNMDDKAYEERYGEALSYLRKYFYPVEEKYLKEFII